MPTNTTSYTLGDSVRLQTVVYSSSGAATNTTVNLIVTGPAGPAVKYGPVSATNSTTLDHIALGTWRKLIFPTSAGLHKYQWNSTGTVTVSTGSHFTVRRRFASTST